jgi:hypothetical protein
VLPTEEQTAENGLINAVVEGDYVAAARDVAQPASAPNAGTRP